MHIFVFSLEKSFFQINVIKGQGFSWRQVFDLVYLNWQILLLLLRYVSWIKSRTHYVSPIVHRYYYYYYYLRYVSWIRSCTHYVSPIVHRYYYYYYLRYVSWIRFCTHYVSPIVHCYYYKDVYKIRNLKFYCYD